ncbi:CerR family C-terminal domain-containing protein [Isosphaeraceae bacterium EP7]
MNPEHPRDRILQAAVRVFAEKGFECGTIRSICKLAEVNIAAVNYYFNDKANLYIAAVLHAHQCRINLLEIDPEAEPAAQLRVYIRHFLCKTLAVVEEGDWTQALILRELMAPTPATETLVREGSRPFYDQLQGILRRICPDANPRRMHALAFSVLGQCLHYRLVPHISSRLANDLDPSELNVAFLADHISSMTLAALGLLPPLDSAGETVAAVGSETSGDPR